MLVLTLVAIDDDGSSCAVVAVIKPVESKAISHDHDNHCKLGTNLLPLLPLLLLLCLCCHCSCLMVQNTGVSSFAFVK